MKNQILIFVTLLLMTTSAFAQETATVFIARKGLYTGYMGPVKVFMDDKLICQINNNSFSVHNVPGGKHKFSIQWSGKESKKESNERGAVNIEIESGKEYYLRADRQDKGMTSFLFLEEITSNSWSKLKEGLDQDDCL